MVQPEQWDAVCKHITTFLPVSPKYIYLMQICSIFRPNKQRKNIKRIQECAVSISCLFLHILHKCHPQLYFIYISLHRFQVRSRVQTSRRNFPNRWPPFHSIWPHGAILPKCIWFYLLYPTTECSSPIVVRHYGHFIHGLYAKWLGHRA